MISIGCPTRGNHGSSLPNVLIPNSWAYYKAAIYLVLLGASVVISPLAGFTSIVVPVTVVAETEFFVHTRGEPCQAAFIQLDVPKNSSIRKNTILHKIKTTK
jgi:hypothetical protein